MIQHIIAKKGAFNITSKDIIGMLDPDMIKCLITKKWINIHDKCKWDAIKTLETKKENHDYWNCLKHCPRFLNSPKGIFYEGG